MRGWLVLLACLPVACGGSPISPTPAPAPTPAPVTPPPVVVATVAITACPPAILGFAVDLHFYQELGCNAFDGPMQPVRTWTKAPQLYLRTVDDAGQPIDAVTLDTVQQAMTEIAPVLTANRFPITVERGADTRQGRDGYVTVTWPTTADGNTCGLSDVGLNGGLIRLYAHVPTCGCNGSALRPETARHELGHAFGYWHTDDPSDLMSNLGATKPCDRQPSARELAAFAYHYR